ncbi:hypothetical protein [Variovorax boronicumulans]|uniref:hypothetical protein n=1 Tax=Variovorax boronicumulans TaxID=436515 RepID=UPI003393AC8E
MSPDQTTSTFDPRGPRVAASLEASSAASAEHDGKRYWAPCLAVALVAVSLFYVSLQDLVRESAARAPTLPPAIMPAYVEPARLAGGGAVPDAGAQPAVSPAQRMVALTTFEPSASVAEAPPAKAVPAVVEVHKCLSPEGAAAYTDGPCPDGASTSTLRLPQNVKVAGRL